MTLFRSRRSLCCAGLLLFPVAPFLRAQQEYWSRYIFDNSLTPDRYFFSSANVAEPSTLQVSDEKLPVSTTAKSAPNSIRLTWKSAPGGSWDAGIEVEPMRNRVVQFSGGVLSFWIYSPTSLTPADLPSLQLRDDREGFSRPLSLSRFVSSIRAENWTRVRVPLRIFQSLSYKPFVWQRLDRIYFQQSSADAAEHTLLVDEIRVEPEQAATAKVPPTPLNLKAKSYARHIDLTWNELPSGDNVDRYTIYRSVNGKDFEAIGIQQRGFGRYADFLGDENRVAFYRVTASDANYHESKPSAVVKASTRHLNDDQLLDMVEETSVRYYFEAGSHASAGMTLENVPGDDNIVATGATGFGIMALIAASHRHYISEEQFDAKLQQIVGFLEKTPRYHGAWSHFHDGRTAQTSSVFGKYDDGGDIVETAFLAEGLLTARQYLARSERLPVLRKRIDQLWKGVEWDWYRRLEDSPFLYWHWSKDYGWLLHHPLVGWNETMMAYILAVGSPTHSIPASSYYDGWAGQSDIAIRYRGVGKAGDHYSNGHEYFGILLPVGGDSGGPLFFVHYSFFGLNPHQFSDRYANYFENNRAQALVNHAYCIANPLSYRGYSDRNWGLTASDGITGYVPHEPRADKFADDGTMTPTGAIASFPYTPELSMKALHYFYEEEGARLWGIYGFRDAFNLTKGWYARIYMGLNQAPMTIMIENYRSGLLWDLFMSAPEVQTALQRISALRK